MSDAEARLALEHAIDRGDLEALERAIDRGASLRGVLLRAVSAEPPRETVVRALLRRGCSVSDRRDGRTAVELARARGHLATAAMIEDPANHGGPLWHREFVADGGPRIVVVARMADGFGFEPDDVVHPFAEGGARDGYGWPLAPRAARRHLEALLPHWGERLEWFRPFVDRVVAGEDFSLRALVREAVRHGATLTYLDGRVVRPGA